MMFRASACSSLVAAVRARTTATAAAAASAPLYATHRHNSSSAPAGGAGAGSGETDPNDKYYSLIAGRSKPKNHDPTKTAELIRLWREATPRAEAERRFAEAAEQQQQQQQEAAAAGGVPRVSAVPPEGVPARSRHQDELDDAHALGRAADGTPDVAGAHGGSFKDTRPLDPRESEETRRRRLIFQSRYRGMVEMDLICGHFARCRLATLPAEQLAEYDTLLKQLDNDLFRWLVMGQAPPAEIEALRCFHTLKDFVEKERKELLGDL